MEYKEKNGCTRCGTCCLKGGPALHVDDLALVRSGKIPAEALYTIRKGEYVRDNIYGGLKKSQDEIIKVRSHLHDGSCFFYDRESHSCRIYLSRPSECRILECWNPEKAALYHDKERISRKNIFSHISWLWDIICEHEQKCGMAQVEILAKRRETGDKDASASLQALVSYDSRLRRDIADSIERDIMICELFFGRPLSEILKARFGINVERSRSSYMIQS